MPSPRRSHAVVVAVVVVPPDSRTQYRRPDINSFRRRPIEDIMEEEEYEDEWERWCSRCRAIDHAALQSYRNDNALERHVLRTFSLHRRVASRLPPPIVMDDEDEDVVSLVVPASWNSESARIPR
jgi:hypothetical protein